MRAGKPARGKGSKMKKPAKLNEIITFKFYTKDDAQGFYNRRIAIFGNSVDELKMYEVAGLGWAVEVLV